MYSNLEKPGKRVLTSREDLFDALSDLRGFDRVEPLIHENLDRDSARRLEREVREHSGFVED